MNTLDNLFWGISIYILFFAETTHVNNLLEGKTEGVNLNVAFFDLTLCIIYVIIFVVKVIYTKRKIKARKEKINE